jgi:hypothetical protein
MGLVLPCVAQHPDLAASNRLFLSMQQGRTGEALSPLNVLLC